MVIVFNWNIEVSRLILNISDFVFSNSSGFLFTQRSARISTPV